MKQNVEHYEYERYELLNTFVPAWNGTVIEALCVFVSVWECCYHVMKPYLVTKGSVLCARCQEPSNALEVVRVSMKSGRPQRQAFRFPTMYLGTIHLCR